MKSITTATLLVVITLMGFAHAKIQSKVKCLEDTMIVELLMTDNIQDLYLDQLKNYPDVACKPQRDGNKATFTLSLIDIYKCGITRISNNLTGRRVYYHRIVAERPDGKDLITAKCIHAPVGGNITNIRMRRNVLPAGFQEPEDLEITKSYTTNAPEPILGVAVRQNGEIVTGELNVSPGTPLQMEIFLDKGSAPVYGLLVNYMQVSDTKNQEETIIFNGCSIDPYLFENFNTVDGDFLSAKFRAFKFPESTYVQFRGTVNVCLDKCKGMECKNGQVGYGRRKREVTPNSDENKLFEVSMSTLFQIKFLQDDTEESKIHIIGTRKRNNETITNISGNQIVPQEQEIHVAEVQEEIIDLELMRNAATTTIPSNNALLALIASTTGGLIAAVLVAVTLANF